VAEHKEKSQLIGDFLREMSVLIVVFLPLDAFFQNKLDWSTIGVALLIGGALLWWGLILEGREEL
jgi:hypothetical protein